ncbi:MAG: hypothetical protein ACREMW_09630 [Gemmatimonadales bacterium]
MSARIIAVLAAAAALAACGDKKTVQDTMPGAGSMQGMAMRSDSLVPMMRAHLDSMGTMPAQFTAAMLAQHDAMASQLLDAMGSDMRMMGMQTDSTWAALTDSVRQDLADLPTLSGRGLDARMKAHQERMRRLLAMHEGMMRGAMSK